MSEHWYDSNGVAVHEVPKAKGDGMRATTIRDARTHGLFPSVTTVLGILSKPQLDRWKLEQVVAAAQRVGVSSNWDTSAIIDNAFAQVDDAADLGTEIHAALEAHFQRKPYDAKLTPYVEAVAKWVEKEAIAFDAHELRLVNKKDGYAGTTDAVIRSPRGRGILDFKSRKTTPGKPCTPYDTQPMQIAAYHVAKFGEVFATSDCGVNVYISTTEPGRIEATWYDSATLAKEWDAFKSILTVWRHMKQHDPRS